MMTLHGVDVFLWTPTTPDLPKSYGKFVLDMISNRGTKVYPPPAPDITALDWPQCRYLSEQEVSNDEIDALVAHLTSLGWTWSKCQKLYKLDGVNQFSQPY